MAGVAGAGDGVSAMEAVREAEAGVGVALEEAEAGEVSRC